MDLISVAVFAEESSFSQMTRDDGRTGFRIHSVVEYRSVSWPAGTALC